MVLGRRILARLPRRRVRYVWPREEAFEARRAWPEIVWLVGREWSPLWLLAGGGWLAGACSWRAPALVAAAVALAGVEECAHLAAAWRLQQERAAAAGSPPLAAPAPWLSLLIERPLRVTAEVWPPLPPAEAAAAALAGPLAAALWGFAIVTLPIAVLAAARPDARAGLPEAPPSPYPLATLAWLPLIYLAGSALPLPGTDAAGVVGYLRAAGGRSPGRAPRARRRRGPASTGTRAGGPLLRLGLRLAATTWFHPPAPARLPPEGPRGRPHAHGGLRRHP